MLFIIITTYWHNLINFTYLETQRNELLLFTNKTIAQQSDTSYEWMQYKNIDMSINFEILNIFYI